MGVARDNAKIEAAAREALYDTEIAPALLQLAAKAQAAGLSLVAVVEWAPGEIASTAALQKGAGAGVRHALAAARAGSNADALIMGLMREAQDVGHSSACLKLLGVPMVPAKS